MPNVQNTNKGGIYVANAIDVAKYLIQLRDEDETNGQYFSLSNLKLQKLLYYCQGGHFRWDGEALINNAFFEAWDYGPVIADIYKEFKKFGQSDLHSDEFPENLTINERETIEAVWEQLKNKHAFDLVESTHAEAPWMDSRENNHIFITNDAIRDFFSEQEEDIT